MASYHLTATVGGSGASADHAAYIGRDGKHKKKVAEDDLEAAGHGNLPEWARDDPHVFWQAADDHERANGSTYREFVVALPRELSPSQRQSLVEDFIRQELGDRHVYLWGIHNPKAALEGGEQPHAHIMYSERILDGIERPAEQFFKRYNGKNPEKGGCKKASGGKTKDENVSALLVTRERWAVIQNDHLARHDHAARVDHRSLRDQGIDREPERHLGQAQIQTNAPSVARVQAAREDRKLAEILRNATEAASRRLARLKALAAAVLQRAARRPLLPSREAQPTVAPVQAIQAPVQSTPDRIDELADYLALRKTSLNRLVREGQILEEKHHQTPDREARHAQAIRVEIENMKPPGIFASKATRDAHEARLAGLRSKGQMAMNAAHEGEVQLKRARQLQNPPPNLVDLVIEKQQPGLTTRMRLLLADAALVEQAKARGKLRLEQATTRQRADRVFDEIRSHANARLTKAIGYADDGNRWTALPSSVQKLVEGINQLAGERRELALRKVQENFRAAPASALKLEAEMKAAQRSRDPGISR